MAQDSEIDILLIPRLLSDAVIFGCSHANQYATGNDVHFLIPNK
ncbi:hypothetical protein PTR03_24780 [Serratia nevei]